MKKILVLSFMLLFTGLIFAADFDDLKELAENDDFNGFKELFRRTYRVSDRNEEGATPLIWISSFADPKFAEYLISQGANVNDVIVAGGESADFEGCPAVTLAAWGGNTDMVRFLLRKGANPELMGEGNSETAMDYACMEGNYEVVEALIPYMTNISFSGRNRSHLAGAVDYNKPGADKVVDLLLAAGADVNADEDWDGYTLAHELMTVNDPALFQKFMNLDIDWEKHTQHGATPIFLAVTRSLTLTKYLLEKGVNLDLEEEYYNRTPLHEAVYWENPFTVQLLVDAGAPLSRKSSATGQTPLDLARELDNQLIADILQKKKRVMIPDISFQEELELGFFVNFGWIDNIEFTDFNGRQKKLYDYRGQVVLYNVWATWCSPCVWEMPSLQELYDDFKSRGVTVLAESIDNTMEEARDFMKGNNLTFQGFHFKDDSGRGMYGPYPKTYIVSRDGYLAASVTGSRDWNTPVIRRFIEKLLTLPTTADAGGPVERLAAAGR